MERRLYEFLIRKKWPDRETGRERRKKEFVVY